MTFLNPQACVKIFLILFLLQFRLGLGLQVVQFRLQETDVIDAVAEQGFHFAFFVLEVSRKAAAGSSSDQFFMMRPR